MLGIKDIIIIGIKGNVTIESPIDFKQYENRTDTIHVQSIFIKEMPIKSTLWILILSILIGLILLLLVIFGLYKAGFFKRAKKDELEALKKNEVIETIKIQIKTQNTQTIIFCFFFYFVYRRSRLTI